MIQVGDMVKIREDQINQQGLGHGIVVEVEEEFYKHPLSKERTPRVKVHWLCYNTISFEPSSVLKIISKVTKKACQPQ